MNEKTPAFVTVGCKLPHGLRLSLSHPNKPATEFAVLKGANASRIVGGFGLTENVPGDMMAEWLKQNAKHPAVVNGSIFIHGDARSAESIARERSKVETGLEPIDPVKSGMLRGEDGETDKEALKNYRALQGANPDRNRQRVE